MSNQPQQSLAVIRPAFLLACFIILQFISGSKSVPVEGGTCPPDTFMCMDGSQCIEKAKQCDGTPDCTDTTDEYDCAKADAAPADTIAVPALTSEACTEDAFHCKDDASKCIPQDQVCDGTAQCSDASDEKECAGKCQEPAKFQCHDGQCMLSSVVCDGIADCADSSDESNCTHRTTTTPPDRCARGEFRCPDGTCLSRYRLCDGHLNCDDGSDEDPSWCLYKPSPSDQGSLEPIDLTMLPKGNCSDLDFRCLDDTCIPANWECDSVEDCPDGSDEKEGCMKVFQSNCTKNSFTCKDGRCVEKHLRCDHKEDCLDGSDEEGCGSRIPRGESQVNLVDAKKIENLNEERTFRTQIHDLQLEEMHLKQEIAKEELEAVKKASEYAVELAKEQFRAAELERQAAEDKLRQQSQLYQLMVEATKPSSSAPVE